MRRLSGFVEGVSRCLDLSCSLSNYRSILKEVNFQNCLTVQDADALAGDWQRVGDDVRVAIGKYKSGTD